MVVTRSARALASIQATSPESSGQRVGSSKHPSVVLAASENGAQNSAKIIKEHLKDTKAYPSDDSSIAESQSNRKQSPIPETSNTGGRKSRTALPEMNKPSTDGETSEAESNCSVSEVQNTILRITRRRQILVPYSPVTSVRKRRKITKVHEPHTEEVSDAESHVSGVSRIVPSTRTRRSKAKSRTDLSQESHEEAISDTESLCSDISTFSGITTRKTRSMQRELWAQVEEEDNKIIPENEKQILNTPMNSEDSDIRQTSCLQARGLPQINEPNFSNSEVYNDFGDCFHGKSGKNCQSLNIREEKQANVAPLKEIANQDCKSLDEEAEGMIDEGKGIEKNSQSSFTEIQDTSFQQSVSQRHSTPQNNKTTSKHSNQNCENIMKSLVKTFAVVEVDRWTEEGKSTTETCDLAPSGGSGSDEEECRVIAGSEDMNEKRDVDFECGTKLYKSEELNTSQDKDDSILLLLSSDENQQSENSEVEEDTVCFVENSAQKGSLDGDSENKVCDNALFVIDTTPGLSADKNFYLDEEDKASEVATEEEKDEEEDEESDESSDQDKNKDDEFSDEDDLLNDTKSKLLKLTSSSIDPGLNIKQLGGLYINFNADKLQSNKKILTHIKEKKKNEVMQKAVITPDFEKNYCVPPYRESKHELQKKRRKERQKTAGDGWFGMKAPELTDELKNDLKALKMRAGMDPKRFYKKNDRDGFPKYFQIGTIVDNPADFYHSRIPKKQRKKTIVDELLADSEFRRYNRRKYSEIMAEKAANAAGKKFRKKKKFRN